LLILMRIGLLRIISGFNKILITGKIVSSPANSSKEIIRERGISTIRLFLTKGGNSLVI
jgi:hypothetical protein